MKSLQEFRQWAIKTKSVSNPTSVISSKYRGQCVSLIQQYIKQVFGIPYKPRGHAKDFVPPTFKRINVRSKLKPGDVVRYGSTHGGGYGHIVMIDDDGRVLEQNYNYTKRVRRSSRVRPGYDAVFRPTKKFKVKNTVKRKTNYQVAKEIADGKGKWGNMPERRRNLQRKGYNYNTVQNIVNKLMAEKSKPRRKSTVQVAREIVQGRGNWGNGWKRRVRLTAKGYNYRTVQKIVNQLMR